MKTCLHALGLALLAAGMGCTDFEKAEREFCERNPDRCDPQASSSTLAFTTSPQTAQVGECSAVATVQLQDSRSNPVSVTADTTVALSAAPADGFQFFAEASCTGTAVTSVTLRAGSNSASFYFKGTAPGTVTLTASSGGFTTQSATITPVPTQLRFSTVAHTTPAGACSSIVTVQAVDARDTPAAVLEDTAVDLTESGAPGDTQYRFYSDASCGTATTRVTIPARQSSASLYYKGERARTVTLMAAATGLATATQDHTVGASNASALLFSPGTPAQTLLAGTCSGIRTVETRDAFGNLATNGATVNFSGSSTAEFFSDGSCTTRISQLTLPAGSGSASFYYKGFTGGLNAQGTLTLTAAATGLTSATQGETVIPTVRTGSCSMPETSVTCTITPALQDVSKAFLVFQATSANTTAAQANVQCFLNSTSQVVCSRTSGDGADVNIRWSVAELPSGVAVQHRSAQCAADATTFILANVMVDRTFLLLSSQSSGVGYGVARRAVLLSQNEAEVQQIGGCEFGKDLYHLQAADYAGAVVQRGSAFMDASVQVDLLSFVAPDRSILLYSYYSESPSWVNCAHALRGELTNSGTRLTFSRGKGDSDCTGSGLNISWEVVEFPVGTVVHQVTQQMSGYSETARIPAVDLSRTIVIGGGQGASGQLQGEGEFNSASNLISDMRAQVYLRDNTTLEFSRETPTTAAAFTAYVVQLKP